MTEEIKKLYELRDRKDQLNQELKTLNEEIKTISEIIIEEMSNQEVSSVTVLDKKVHFITDRYYSFTDREKGINALLQNEELRFLLTANTRSLSSYLKGLTAEGQPIPAELEPYIKYYEEIKIGVRKA